ncbi:MAG: galactose oxidase [Planctomycetota bacterium]|jgi:galactose oxidase
MARLQLTKRISLVATVVLTTGVSLAQTDQGIWEAPFNHVVPPSWQNGQALWDGEQLSAFADPLDPHRFMAAHIAVIPRGDHRGRLLVMNWMRKDHVHGVQHWAIVDVTGTVPRFSNHSLPMPGSDIELFCGGHAWTADGQMLMAGGARYENDTLFANRLCYRFDPTAPLGNSMWTREPDMAVERWYPTVTPMGDNPSGTDHLLVSGGWKDINNEYANRTYESFLSDGVPGSGRWEQNALFGGRALFRGPQVVCTDSFGIYPRDVLLSDGSKFSAGMASRSYRLTHTPEQPLQHPSWEVQPTADARTRWYGSTFLMPDIHSENGRYRDVVVRLGGALVTWDTSLCDPDSLRIPRADVEVCSAADDVSAVNWTWTPIAPMAFARNNPNTTLLPEGSVLISGGRQDSGSQFVTNEPVMEAEIFHETPLSMRTLAPSMTRRGYHASTALLPDGRVIHGGGEKRELDYEIFQPPYLTDGSVRPVVVNAPETLIGPYASQHRLSYAPLPAGIEVERVTMLKPMAHTHHADTNQRYVELEIVNSGGGTGTPLFVDVVYPANSNVAPRGDYMLFLITTPQRVASRGTPSQAVWARIE